MHSSSLAPCPESRAHSAPATPVLSTRAYAWMLVLTIVGGLEIGLLLLDISPILPLVRQQYHVSYVAAGWAISVTIVAHTLAIALLGFVAGSASPRILLIFGLVFLLVSSVMRATAPNFPALVASRAVTGLGTGCLVIGGITAITLLSPPHVRVRDQGYFGAAQQLGIMLTLLTAPIGVHAFGIRVYWGLIAGQLLLTLLVFTLRYPGSRLRTARAPRARPLAVVRDGYGWLLGLANMFGYGVFVGVTAWTSYFLVDRFRTSPSQTALLTAVATLFAFVGRLTASPLLRVIRVRWLISGFIACSAASVAAVPLAPNQQMAALLLLVFAFTSSAPFGAIFGSIADRPAPSGIAARITLVTISSNLVALLLPVLIGYTVSLTHDFAVAFWLTAVLTGLAALIVMRSSIGRSPGAVSDARASAAR
jgi:predicted MFS family arabinose efflux permease